jgi:flagellar assembly protein FliH
MSTIIKNSTPEAAGAVAPFHWVEMTPGVKAESAAAQRGAAEVIAQAERDAETIRRQAHEQGRAAALVAAEQIAGEKIDEELSTVVPALAEAVDSIRAAKAQWLLHWERAAVSVATAIARRVIRREVAQNPQITLDLVREALELAAGSADIQLHLHPDDVTTLGRQAQQLVAEVARLGQAQIVADPQIDRGGCRVETRFGVIDQQFDAQLARIEEELI